jgi:ribonuclease J
VKEELRPARENIIPPLPDEDLGIPPFPPVPPGNLRIIPLGGLGEIGKNMMALHYEDSILVIDAGLMFPTEEMPGVDLVIPDINYLMEHVSQVRGIILTHGHEDHIGGMPYIMSELGVPVYGTELTLGLLEGKLTEFAELQKPDFRKVRAGDMVDLGHFQVEFFRAVHSISEGVGLIVRTPVGTVVHSGDFKFDEAPIDGKPADIERLSALGDEGVLLLFSDSTYAERPGHSTSERVVGRTLEMVFKGAPGRIIITTFASSIPRLQQIVDVSFLFKKKICFIGRSLVETVEIATGLGYLKLPPDMRVEVEQIASCPDEELVIVTTGSQGEPMSALTLMATGNHKWVSIKENDTVIISATPVPGNETLVMKNINLLFRLGAEVIYNLAPKSEQVTEDMGPRIHVSGHGSRDELKKLLLLIKPRYFVPVHGEYRHLVHHGRLAREAGVKPENIFLLEDGDVLEVSGREARLCGKIKLDDILVDGLGIGDVGRAVLRERRLLSQDGVCLAVVGLDSNSREILSGPEVISRGFVYVRESEELIEDARLRVREVLEKNGRGDTDLSVLKNTIKQTLARFLYERTKRRPIIVPVILEI